MADEFDVAIVGGGMVGATLALALAEALPNKMFAVIEPAQRQDEQQPSFDDRVIALAAGSVDILEDLGVWTYVNQLGTGIKDIEVTDSNHIGYTRLAAKDYQRKYLGQVIASKGFGQSVNKALDGYANVRWYCPDRLVDIEQHKDKVSLTLESGVRINANLLVAADGGMSTTRTLLNIDVATDNYQQNAIIANVKLDSEHDNIAYERFTESGPLALLPMERDLMSLVWTITPDHVQRMQELSDAEFLGELQHQVGFRCGRFIDVSRRVCYPLQLVKAKQSISHRCVLIGNASHTIHPIAGQGFNLGIRDIFHLFNNIVQGVDADSDIGSYSALAQYQHQRELDQQATITLTDSLVRIFSNDYLPMSIGRNTGLCLMNKVPKLKSLLARKALGEVR